MTRKDIAAQLAANSELTPAQAAAAVNQVVDIMADALAKDEKIYFRGFATIKVVERPARHAYNFASGKTIKVPAKRILRIDAGKEFAAKLNG